MIAPAIVARAAGYARRGRPSRKRGIRTFACQVIVLVAAAFGPVGAAQATSLTGDRRSFDVELKGEIPVACGFAAGATPPRQTDIGLSDTATIPFAIDCNVPVRLQVRSRHGALRREGGALLSAASRSVGFTDEIPYTAVVSIDMDHGERSSSCSSAQLQSGIGCAVARQGLTTSRPVFGAAARIELTTRAKADRLVAGPYRDILEIEVGPR